ncbi:hypothetical protein ID866_955 [Astraeus odoratus]|nr:hypothetical protein ID866_955 [Astraeus odoratus]
MRNLVQLALQTIALNAEVVEQYAGPMPDGSVPSIAATAFDVDRNVTYSAMTLQGKILIWKTSGECLFSLEEPSFSFCGSYITPESQIASLRVLAESSQLALVTRAGDIVIWDLDDSGNFNNDADVQGTVETGVLAASWSPDDTLLSLVTSV